MKYLFTLILIITLLLPISGCASPETQEAGGKSFAWKISSDVNHVYLLGSVHIADKDIYPLADSIEDAYEMSEGLVVEVNINEVSPLKIMLLLEKYGKYPEGEGLEDHLPRELYRELESQLITTGLPISAMNDYRPWVIVLMMGGGVIEGYSPEYGIDLYFLDKAVESDKEVLELQTAEYQIQLLSGLPDDLMILALETGLEEPLDVADIDLMFELWKRGDTTGLEEFLLKDLGKEPALAPFYDTFITERNYTMLEKIEEFLSDDAIYFIVVGAAHLVGEEGLLNLLEEKGYSLEQLEN